MVKKSRSCHYDMPGLAIGTTIASRVPNSTQHRRGGRVGPRTPARYVDGRGLWKRSDIHEEPPVKT